MGEYIEEEDTKLKTDNDPLLSSAQDLQITLYAHEPGDHRDQHSAILDVSSLYETSHVDSQDSGVGGTSIPEAVDVKDHIKQVADAIRLGWRPSIYNLRL